MDDDAVPRELAARIDEGHEATARSLAGRNHRTDAELHAEARRRLLRALFNHACSGLGVAANRQRHSVDPELSWLRDAAPISSDWLGRIDEYLLARDVRRTPGGRVRVEHWPRRRKPSGIFYTPRLIVGFLIERTLGPRWRSCRILDPACGGGAFLLAAFERLLRKHGCDSFAEGQTILLKHIHGLDIDAQAAETTRLALALKLIESCHDRRNVRLDHLLQNLELTIRTGDAIDGLHWESERGFDMVIGNPPYGATLRPEQRVRLAKRFGAGTTDTAALFMLEAQRLTRPGGVCGLVVPKPFAYSSTWKRVRDRLLPELHTLLDAGKAWKAVKLEQVAYVLRRGRRSDRYQCFRREGDDIVLLGDVPKRDCEAFGCILNDVTPAELGLARKLRGSGVFLGDLVTNTRGGMLQSAVKVGGSGLRVIGGKQLACYRLTGEKGRLRPALSLPENARVHPGAILVQNIVAHIARPIDHIRVIGTLVGPEATGLVILDTVNQLRNRSRLSSQFLLGVLLSRVVSWYLYRFVFGKAIRTMHFDGPVTCRIPIPAVDLSESEDEARHRRATRLVHRLLSFRRNSSRSRLQAELDRLVCRLFHLSDEEIELVERAQPSHEGEA